MGDDSSRLFIGVLFFQKNTQRTLQPGEGCVGTGPGSGRGNQAGTADGARYCKTKRANEWKRCARRGLLWQRVNPKSNVLTTLISRAFIPPWSLVMTKPETLGP